MIILIPFIIFYLKIGIGFVLLMVFWNPIPFLEDPKHTLMSVLLWPTVIQMLYEMTNDNR